MRRLSIVFAVLGTGLIAGCPASPPDLCDYGACDGADSGGGDTGIDAPKNCDLKKDPKDSPDCVADTVGIFVAESGLDTNDGTRAKPVKTINHALTLTAGKPRIYVCAGTYPAALIDKGVSVYGGFDCATWAPTGAGTLIESPINAMTVKTPAVITVADLTLSAKTGPSAGDSTIAALVTTGSSVTFRRVKFLAADGKAGAPGSENTTVMAQATKGPNASGNSGGVFGTACTCPDGVTTGGPGGSGPSQGGGNGEPALSGGAGGAGGTVACVDNGGAGFGKTGSTGTSPAPAPGASQLGTLSDSGWAPGKGTDGGAGTRGQGGGGGGARTGGGGGAGGCGGCGGEKGAGGGGGGASVALAAIAASVTLEACELSAGNGAAGGKGGAGQKGQAGGNPGGDPNFVGCNGGQGGNGGDGGSGGGGIGGLSVGILHEGTKPATDTATDSKITIGVKGSKGIGGTPGTNDGTDGVAQAILQVP